MRRNIYVTVTRLAVTGPLEVGGDLDYRSPHEATGLDQVEAGIVRFIEFMDVRTTNGWRLDDVVSAEEMLAAVNSRFPLEALPPNYPGEVANRFRYRDGMGEIGVIASVTQPFCGSCTRARLSAEGSLYTCLFASKGEDLRAAIRSGVDVEASSTGYGAIATTGIRRSGRHRLSTLQTKEQLKESRSNTSWTGSCIAMSRLLTSRFDVGIARPTSWNLDPSRGSASASRVRGAAA